MLSVEKAKIRDKFFASLPQELLGETCCTAQDVKECRRDTLPVPEAVSNIIHLLQTLESAIEDLEGRLGGVMTPPLDEGQGVSQVANGRSELASTLEEIVLAISVAISRIDGINRRLEL